MKRLIFLLIAVLLLSSLAGCGSTTEYEIAATTLPVYDFTSALCSGTGITVGRLITEQVSCLHEYTLQVRQMRMLEKADIVVISGAGLEDFLADALSDSNCLIDASAGVHLHTAGHSHDHSNHKHEQDAHIWLSAENARIMVQNICAGLTECYPQFAHIFSENQTSLLSRLETLECYGKETLSSLSCRDMITFHDGFSYFAESFGLNILHSVEEESGSEASAAELKELIGCIRDHRLPAIFIEASGSDSAAKIISTETGTAIFSLDMGLSDRGYFEMMYHNINTVKEALG